MSGVKVKGNRIIVKFDINPTWDLSMDEKVRYLEEWILAKVKTIFKVVSVSTDDEAN